MKQKSAFSLVEVLVSITLFSIILLFLYDALDITTKSNQFYSKKLDEKLDQNNIKKVLFLDLINKKEQKSTISEDKDQNSILSFKTFNTYHNPFYTNVTYLLTKKGNLMRIESRIPFNKKKLTEEFFKNTFIDILATQVKKLKIKEKNRKYFVYLEYHNKTKLLFAY